MKIIHTSDWHLGHSLYGRKRYQEFEAFLQWLLDYIQTKEVHALLIAGDVFDTTTPSNKAMELYYRFLQQVTLSGCRHVVIIAGNHDSPSLLNAPKTILKSLNVHVIGSATESPEDEVLVLHDQNNVPELIVCPVPYLRDRDIRKTEAGESISDKSMKLLAGIQSHYQKVCDCAEQKRQQLNPELPVIAMGHLFTAGGKTIDGDGVRDLYVGSLAHVESQMFPESIDYLALGHLHVPQRVSGSDLKRYSGSPLPMSFGEAQQQKQVLLLHCGGKDIEVQEVHLPCFQALQSIRGDLKQIEESLKKLNESESPVWVEILYEGKTIIGDLQEALRELAQDSTSEILRIKNKRVFEQALTQMNLQESLEDLSVDDVFRQCLEKNERQEKYEISESQKAELMSRFHEVCTLVNEEDTHAE